jgi:ABC-2 type transport system permease protein
MRVRVGGQIQALLRSSLMVAAQYRADFLIDGAIEIVWMATTFVPLLVVFHHREAVAGWSFGEALVVVGFFTLLQAVIEGALNPSFYATVEHVREGTLDLLLMKPIDAQLLLFASRISVWRATNVLTAMGLFGVAFFELGRAPKAADIAAGIGLFFAAVVILHALWTLAACSIFFAVRVSNLTEIFNSVVDAARWPSSIYRGAVRFALTFVIPLALLTTAPAKALLGAIDVPLSLWAIGEGVALAWIARRAFRRALRHYTSTGS